MHGIDMVPISHPNGYRQVLFQDYRNIFGNGHSALYQHTSPHKQFYLYCGSSLEDYLSNHLRNLRQNMYLIQNGKISYFYNMKTLFNKGEDMHTGIFQVQENFEFSAQSKFEMLQSSIYP